MHLELLIHCMHFLLCALGIEKRVCEELGKANDTILRKGHYRWPWQQIGIEGWCALKAACGTLKA